MRKNLLLLFVFCVLALPLVSCGSADGPRTGEMRYETPATIPIVGKHQVQFTVMFQTASGMQSVVENARVTDGVGELKPYPSIYFPSVSIPTGTTGITYHIFSPAGEGVCGDRWLYFLGTVDVHDPQGFVTEVIDCVYPER